MVSPELSYLLEKEADLEAEYSGHFIAILKRSVVAVGRSAAEVYRNVKEQGLADPLVTYIPREGDEALLI